MTPASLPWYKQRWPWLLISVLIVVIAAIITMVIAVRTADPLVNDDYYKRGKSTSNSKPVITKRCVASVWTGDVWGQRQKRTGDAEQPDQAAPDTLTLLMLHPYLARA